MSWVEVLIVFLVCHMVGDFLLQTDRQAAYKGMGLGPDPVHRRALLSHVTCYTLAFLPAFIWIGIESTAWLAALSAVLVFVPHYVQDDGRFVRWWMRGVKGTDPDEYRAITVMVDQSMHIVMLMLLAILVDVLSS